jgi:hypothetical protein
MKRMSKNGIGRKPVNPRIVLGSLIIKHLCDLDDRETIDQISENIYMQCFLGYPSFTSEKPFDASLFVEIRKRLSLDFINTINEKIVELKTRFEASTVTQTQVSAKNDTVAKGEGAPSISAVSATLRSDGQDRQDKPEDSSGSQENSLGTSNEITCEHETVLPTTSVTAETHKGRLLIDATVCPQDIAYPTDLDLLSDAREKSEQLIDSIYKIELHGEKPRTDRKKARKEYLRVAQSKKKTKKQIRSAIRKQLGYLYRNTICKLKIV